MAYLATVSSKGQLVIPAALRRKYKLKSGTRVSLSEVDGNIMINPGPYEAMLGLEGILSHVQEDVESWWMEEKRREREREDAK